MVNKMCKEAIEPADVTIQLAKQYLNGSLIFNFEPDSCKDFTWEQQEKFLELTINSTNLKKYPVNNDFSRLFLKKIINILEGYQEVHDDIYSFLCSSMNCKLNDKFYYRHYVVTGNLVDTIIVKETKNMVLNGTTGLKTWEAAFMLSDWALCNKEVFNGKKILELGAGVGFTGITIAKYCYISSMTMSDYHMDVLKTINDNIQINFPECIVESKTDSLYKDKEKSLGVLLLDWNHVEDVQRDLSPDIIIGADIVYDPSILRPLCDVFKLFYKRNPQLQIYIASVIRNEDTFNKFIENLELSKLQFEKIPFIENINLNWNKNINGCLIKITSTEC